MSQHPHDPSYPAGAYVPPTGYPGQMFPSQVHPAQTPQYTQIHPQHSQIYQGPPVLPIQPQPPPPPHGHSAADHPQNLVQGMKDMQMGPSIPHNQYPPSHRAQPPYQSTVPSMPPSVLDTAPNAGFVNGQQNSLSGVGTVNPRNQTPPSHPHLPPTNPVPMQVSSLSNPPLSHPDPIPSMVNASTHSHLHSQINAPLRPPTSTTPQSQFNSQKPLSNLSAPPLRHHLSPTPSPYPPPNLEPPPTNFLSSVPQPGPQTQTTNPLMSAPSGLSTIQAPVQGMTQYPGMQQMGAPAGFQQPPLHNPGANPGAFSHPVQAPPGQQQQFGQHTGTPLQSFQQQVLPPELEPINLLENRNLLPKYVPEPPLPKVSVGVRTHARFDPYMLCSTLNNIPQSKSLLTKSRLPLGVLIQPFRDVHSDKLPVISTSCIIRCHNCRTYINPYIAFLPGRKWKCNICFRANPLPEGFNPDEAVKSSCVGSYSEVQFPLVEYIANSDYALRPPQPPVYVFVLDVTYSAVSSGALSTFCDTLIECIDDIPGDSRTQVGLITFNSSVQFYGIRESLPALIYEVPDLEEVFLPSNTNLMVFLKEAKESFKQLLRDLPSIWANTHSTESCLGMATESAFKMISKNGGRISILAAQRPTKGNGAMSSEQATNYLKKYAQSPESIQLAASTDYYKKLALDCCEKQVAVDLFITCSQFTDLFSLAALPRFSSGQVRYYPTLSPESAPNRTKAFQEDLKRYFTRRIGFEAVMRVRCSPGLALHTFHGNCFVRSTDLLALPNVNPDHSFAIQLSYEDSLEETEVAFLQSALLYTSVRGERRIRVATIALPVTSKLLDIYAGANAQAIAAFVSKMAVDRMVDSSLGDARTGVINFMADLIKSYAPLCRSQGSKSNSLTLPSCLRLVPLYILSLLKHPLLRVSSSVQVDERGYQTILLKTLPLDELLTSIYPTLHSLHDIVGTSSLVNELDGDLIKAQILHCSAEKLTLVGAYFLDVGEYLILYLCSSISDEFIQKVFGVTSTDEIVDSNSTSIKELPVMDNMLSERVRILFSQIKCWRARTPVFMVLTDKSIYKMEFAKRLVEDKFEEMMSYYEFLNYLRSRVSK